MSDEPEGHGAPYPDHDTAWRSQKADAKNAIKGVLNDYDTAVALAAVSEVASESAHRWAEHAFSERYDSDE